MEGGKKMQLMVTEFLFVSLSKSSALDAISSCLPLVSLLVFLWSSPNFSASVSVSCLPGSLFPSSLLLSLLELSTQDRMSHEPRPLWEWYCGLPLESQAV